MDGLEKRVSLRVEPFWEKSIRILLANAESYDDITKTDFTIWKGRVDVLTGGFPCQPYSVAGKQKGTADERHLWPEMLRAIREIKPRWVVGENVRGLISWNGGMVFQEVQTELEAEGYKVLPFLLPAASVNAPHKRDRVWFVGQEIGLQTGRKVDLDGNGRAGIASNANDQRLQGCEKQRSAENCGKNRNKQFARLFQSNWENFPTQSPVCDGDDGLSSRLDGITFPKWRNESIKAGGNAIVPQVIFEIYKAISEYENLINSK